MEQSDANSSGHSCPACHLAEPAINAAKTEAPTRKPPFRWLSLFPLSLCMNWSTEISNMLTSLTKTPKPGYCPLFSIFIIVWDVRPTSSARYSCVQPLFSRASFIASPKIKPIFIMFHTISLKLILYLR